MERYADTRGLGFVAYLAECSFRAGYAVAALVFVEVESSCGSPFGSFIGVLVTFGVKAFGVSSRSE